MAIASYNVVTKGFETAGQLTPSKQYAKNGITVKLTKDTQPVDVPINSLAQIGGCTAPFLAAENPQAPAESVIFGITARHCTLAADPSGSRGITSDTTVYYPSNTPNTLVKNVLPAANGSDAALLILKKNPTGTVVPFTVTNEPPDPNKPFVNAGFPSYNIFASEGLNNNQETLFVHSTSANRPIDARNRFKMSRNWDFYAVIRNTIQHDNGGMSGGPVSQRSNGSFLLIGILESARKDLDRTAVNNYTRITPKTKFCRNNSEVSLAEIMNNAALLKNIRNTECR